LTTHFHQASRLESVELYFYSCYMAVWYEQGELYLVTCIYDHTSF